MNISENFDLTNLAAEDLKHLEKALGVGSIYIICTMRKKNSDYKCIKNEEVFFDT